MAFDATASALAKLTSAADKWSPASAGRRRLGFRRDFRRQRKRWIPRAPAPEQARTSFKRLENKSTIWAPRHRRRSYEMTRNNQSATTSAGDDGAWDITVVALQASQGRQATSHLLDASRDTTRFTDLTCEPLCDRSSPSTLARTSQVAAEEHTVTLTANHVARIQRAYTHRDLVNGFLLVAPLPFRAAAESRKVTQQLIDSFKRAMTGILNFCDDPSVDGVEVIDWVRE